MFLDAAKSGGNSSFLLIIAVLYGAFFWFYIRPRSKKAKARRSEASQVEVGDRVQTIGGLIGTVISRTDTSVTLRTAGGTDLEFIPKAIAQKFVEPVATEPESNE
ncbi:MAG: preprotein translocase subunit YajC [Actinomycetota bacterium]|jgi:preprotein translocase subunit YajC